VGMGLSANTLMGLCQREFSALRKQFDRALDREAKIFATLRADIHNNSYREYSKQFTPDDFLNEKKFPNQEAKIKELVSKGYTPSQAAAIVMSKQSHGDRVVAIDKMLGGGKKKRRA